MAKLVNLARMTVSSAPGTSTTMNLGVAVTGFITFAAAGVNDGDLISYAIDDSGSREVGTAVYSSSGVSLSSRTVINSTNSNAVINASATSQIFVTALAGDIAPSFFARTDSTTQSGNIVVSSPTAGTDYGSCPVTLREIALSTTAQSAYNYAPAINFNWSGRVQTSLAMHADGNFYFRSSGYTGTQYASLYCNVMNGTATTARYADMAERYHADRVYEPGTVVVYGGENEITTSSAADDTAMAGVISTQPGMMLNSEAGTDDTHPFVALVGRVPCKVIGRVRKGQMLTTSSTPGCAMVSSALILGSIIGKALVDKDTDEIGLVEIAVQRS